MQFETLSILVFFFGTGRLLRHSSDEHYAAGEVGQAFGSKTRWQATVRRLYIQPGLRSLATHFLSVCLNISLEGKLMTPYLGGHVLALDP